MIWGVKEPPTQPLRSLSTNVLHRQTHAFSLFALLLYTHWCNDCTLETFTPRGKQTCDSSRYALPLWCPGYLKAKRSLFKRLLFNKEHTPDDSGRNKEMHGLVPEMPLTEGNSADLVLHFREVASPACVPQSRVAASPSRKPHCGGAATLCHGGDSRREAGRRRRGEAESMIPEQHRSQHHFELFSCSSLHSPDSPKSLTGLKETTGAERFPESASGDCTISGDKNKKPSPPHPLRIDHQRQSDLAAPHRPVNSFYIIVCLSN